MDEINLSFVVTTRNRLEFLKVILEDLISSRNADEEIVVIDALSNDGTGEYLKKLYREHKIQKLLIEADCCQAEGWNKGFLLSEGKLIKKITDDDVFDLSAIRVCKQFMLDNPEVDVCISNELFTDDNIYPNFNKHSFYEAFLRWKKKETDSFFFSDPHLLLRRTSLSLIGIFNPRFIMIDYEFSLRISFLKARIAYYSGFNSLSFFRRETISGLIKDSTLYNEYMITDRLYNYKEDNHSHLTLRFKIIKKIKELVSKKSSKIENINKSATTPFKEKYHLLKQELNKLNRNNKTFTKHV